MAFTVRMATSIPSWQNKIAEQGLDRRTWRPSGKPSLNLFEFDRSAARGEMAVRGLWVFSHDNEKGNAPAHKLFELVKTPGYWRGCLDPLKTTRALSNFLRMAHWRLTVSLACMLHVWLSPRQVMTDPPPPSLIPPHGGYRDLKSYQMAEIVFDATMAFCDRFVTDCPARGPLTRWCRRRGAVSKTSRREAWRQPLPEKQSFSLWAWRGPALKSCCWIFRTSLRAAASCRCGRKSTRGREK